MPQSYAKILIHIVFSTKARTPLIHDTLRPEMHAYIAGILRARESQAFRVGGTNDHVHIACSLPRTLEVASLVRDVKSGSSEWAKGKHPAFSWQTGYGVFSIGQSQLPALVRYIDNQVEHHKTTRYREEFVELLQKYRIEYDEKYLFVEG